MRKGEPKPFVRSEARKIFNERAMAQNVKLQLITIA